MANEPVRYKYRFAFEDGKSTEFVFSLDPESLTMLHSSLPNPLPEWTALKFQRCPHCTLDERLESHCPAAVNVLAPVEVFRNSLSYEKADVHIISPERHYMKPTTIQEGLSSMVGLCMATSRCPYMERLRPMVRFHLPFATPEETMYRVLTMYLFAQYVKHKGSGKPDWDLAGLNAIYDNIRKVNKHFAERLRNIHVKDAALNAIINLDCFAISVKFSINFEMLEEIQNLFTAYLD